MAGIRKFWKESACLIVASRGIVPKPPGETLVKKVNTNNSNNTVIPPATKITNLPHLLTMRNVRTQNASQSSKGVSDSSGKVTVSTQCSFPGGFVEDADFSEEWDSLFHVDNKTLRALLGCNSSSSSPIFSRLREPRYSALPAEVALRIAAIRGTFLETGILLAKSNTSAEEGKVQEENKHPIFGSVHPMCKETKNDWRKRVSDDAKQFLFMCEEFSLIPDIWSLYEWSNWLTPLLPTPRMDTAFFLSCVNTNPDSEESGEMENRAWMTPSMLLDACAAKFVDLAPPLIYELSRITRFGTLDDLLQLAWNRVPYRVDQWMPVIVACANGLIFTLPGDDLYPENVDMQGQKSRKPIERPETFEKLQHLFPFHNRLVVRFHDQSISLHCNIPFIHGHILPLNFNHKGHTATKHDT